MGVDLIVVGAGPAGCSAAYHAARAGLEVLLLDQHESRQDRADGDALFPRAVAEVSLMGLADWLEEPDHYKYEGIVVHARAARLRAPNSPANRHGVRGYVIPWFETTTRLLERAREAGARFRGGVRVRSLLRSPSGAVSGVEVGEYGPGGGTPRGASVRYEAPLVIAADGAGDFAAEGTKAPSNGVTRRQYFTGVDGPEKDHLHVLQSDSLKGIGAGYVYYLGDGRAAVGGSVWTRDVARHPETLRESFDRMMGEAPFAGWLRNAEPASEAESWPMKLGMWGAKRASQGLLLAGDAGSMGHPVCGEGYGGAMESGRVAASWAYEARARNDYSASLLSGYERELRRRSAGEYLSGRALMKLLPHMEQLNPLIKACEGDPAAGHTLVDVFSGNQPSYALLKHPGALARTVREVVGR